MRLMTFKYQDQVLTGVRTGGGVSPFKTQKTMVEVIKDGLPELSDEVIQFKDIEFLSPIPHPIHDVICVGLNYYSHIDELKNTDIHKETSSAVYFGKRCKVIQGHNQPITIGNTEKFDYENELAIIIGKECKNITKEEVKDVIFGFSVANDYSARDIQAKHQQWYLGKSGDTHMAMGPWIVTIDESGMIENRTIMTLVNDELRQENNTDNMIYSIEEIVSELSGQITLEPGDIILTGTPAGCVAGLKDVDFLKNGDQVDCMIDGLGVLHNTIVD